MSTSLDGTFSPNRSFLEERVRKHDKDLYEGNGKPSITTRLEMIEDCVEKMSRNSRTIVFLLIGAIVTAVVDMLTHHVH